LSSSDPPADPPSRATAGDSPPGPETLPTAPVLVPGAPSTTPPEAADGPIVPSQPPTSRPGASIFTIEGRAAPGLFVVGWLATLIGIACILVAVLAGGGTASIVLLVGGLFLLSIGLIAAAGSQGIERRTRARLPYRGPSPLLVFAAAIPVSALIVVVFAIPLDLFGVPLDGPIGALLSVTIQALVYIALVRLLVVDTGALDWHTMGVGPLGGSAVVEMGRGALWAVPVIAVTAVVSAVLLQVFPVQPVSPLPPTGEAAGFAVSLLAGVIVAPFGEEILFRAFATTAWVRGLGYRRGLVLAALIFAMAHVLTIGGTNAGEAFGLAVVGFGTRIPVALALGWIFLRRGTVWASFGLHAAFNGILLVLAEAASRSLSTG
jgi:membrane protease YdiL (CAAX protease family)